MDVTVWILGGTVVYAAWACLRMNYWQGRAEDLEECVTRLCNSYGKGSMHEDELQRAWKLLDK